MEFKKLDLVGFKSFVERTPFFIERGLTGIVGPNGWIQSIQSGCVSIRRILEIGLDVLEDWL